MSINHEGLVDYDKGQYVCAMLGGVLPPLADTNGRQEKILYDFVKHRLKATDVWVGMRHVRSRRKPTEGLLVSSLGGQAGRYRNWADGQSDASLTTRGRRCVTMEMSGKREWKARSCVDKFGFYCVTPKRGRRTGSGSNQVLIGFFIVFIILGTAALLIVWFRRGRPLPQSWPSLSLSV